MAKILDKALLLSHLSRFKTKQDEANAAKFAPKEDFDTYKSKVDGLETTGGQPNVIETVKVNGQALTATDKAVDVLVPTKTSDLENDDNVVKDAAYVHTDNNYDAEAVAKVAASQANVIESVKVNGNAVAVSGKAVDITVPTDNASLANGAGYQTASDVATAIAGKANSADLGTAAAAATESTLTDGSNLPTGSAVKSFVEGKGYQTASDVQSAIGAAIATAMDYKGVKAAKADLPASGNKTGDVWHVTADGSEYAWNGSEWEELGVTFDPTGFVQSSEITVATDDDVDALFE